MITNLIIKNSSQNSNREQNTLLGDQSTKTNKPNEREYGLLDDKIVLPKDFDELDSEIEKLFYGEEKNQSFDYSLSSKHFYSINILACS